MVIEGRNWNLAERLLHVGVDVNDVGYNGDLPLQLEARLASVESVKLFVDYQASVDLAISRLRAEEVVKEAVDMIYNALAEAR
jgi:ankyrin repeat protein